MNEVFRIKHVSSSLFLAVKQSDKDDILNRLSDGSINIGSATNLPLSLVYNESEAQLFRFVAVAGGLNNQPSIMLG